MFSIQLYRAKSDPGVIISQISEGKFLNFYFSEKKLLFEWK